MANLHVHIEADNAHDLVRQLRSLLVEMVGQAPPTVAPKHNYEFQPTEDDNPATPTAGNDETLTAPEEPKKRRGRPAKIAEEPVATKAEDVIEQVNDPVEAEKKALGKVISEDEAKAATPRSVDETKAKLLELSEKTTPTSARDFMIEVTGGSQRNTDVPDWMRGAFYDRLVAKLDQLPKKSEG